MLVLTRKKGESILIGNDIKINILEIDGDKVSIGIDAPKNITVMRQELVLLTIGHNMESLRSKNDILKQFTILDEEK